VFNHDSITSLQEGPRLRKQAGFHDRSDSQNLMIRNWFRDLSEAYDTDNPRRRQHRKPVI
jgi:hypothetical protein